MVSAGAEGIQHSWKGCWPMLKRDRPFNELLIWTRAYKFPMYREYGAVFQFLFLFSFLNQVLRTDRMNLCIYKGDLLEMLADGKSENSGVV